MPAVLHGDHAHADIARFLDGNLHRPGGHDDSQSAIAIDAGNARRLTQNFPMRFGIDQTVFEKPDIALQILETP